MLNDLLYRLKAAYKAFGKPELITVGIDPDTLMRMDMRHEIAIVRSAWVGNTILLPEIVMLTPEQSDNVKRYLDYGV